MQRPHWTGRMVFLDGCWMDIKGKLGEYNVLERCVFKGKDVGGLGILVVLVG